MTEKQLITWLRKARKIEQIAQRLGCSERTAHRALEKLPAKVISYRIIGEKRQRNYYWIV